MKCRPECEAALSRLADFLTRNAAIINVCMVDFITGNVFDEVLPCGLRDGLSALSSEELCVLPQKMERIVEGKSGALQQLLAEIGRHGLEALNVTTDREAFLPETSNLLAHFDRVMPGKKTHEVLVMSDVVSNLSAKMSARNVVDVGSGKAYLSQILAAMNDSINVLAIDSASENLRGAKKRSANLEKQWAALIRRASTRAGGQTPPKKGKHWKAKKANEGREEVEVEPGQLSLENIGYDTVFVDTETDLGGLFDSHFPEKGRQNANFGLVGLHTCGNLAPDSLRIFLANKAVKFCCNVGCCYHHLDEAFYTNPYSSSAFKGRSSFPLSSTLVKKEFWLGRNARMIAAQPMDRLINNKQLPSESLLWRAILQHILIQHVPDLQVADQQVGRIALKCADFVDYVEKCFAKLNLELKLTKTEIRSIFVKYQASHGHKLNAFFQLRSLFAPLIEGLILLDRLVFLLQQPEVKEAHLTRLFDAVISPRCYAIIAVRE